MLTIAHLGKQTSYSAQAARQGWPRCHYLSCASFDEVVHAVQSGRAEQGILPVENAIAGAIEEACELLGLGSLQVVGEYSLPITLSVLGRTEDLSRCLYVVSHPKVFEQCKCWLAEHPWLTPVAMMDTALAASMAAKAAAIVAIGSSANVSGELQVIRHNIGDIDDNWTRFVLFRQRSNECVEVR